MKRKRLIKQLDKLFSAFIKARDGRICQKCGKFTYGPDSHTAHIIPVSEGHLLRWDPTNALVLCMFHHLRWGHKNPLEFTDWFKKKFPLRYKYLWKHKEKIKKFTIEELEQLKRSFE